MRGFRFCLTAAVLVTLTAVLSFGVAQAQTSPVVQTDRLDYYPGENVTITGSGFYPGEVVKLVLHEEPPIDPDLTLYAGCDASGNFIDTEFWTDIHDVGVTFTLTATGVSSGLTAQWTFTDSAANLDQWANVGTTGGGSPSPSNDWENGNLGASKSTYFEGDSIPYRLTFGGVTIGPSHAVTIEWDTTKGGKHAIDYITTFNRSVPHVPPLTGELPIDPCGPPMTAPPPCGSSTTFAIPADPQVTGAGVTPIAGNFTLYGGTISSVSAYTLTGPYSGDSSTRITLTFTATVSNPVLAWGGHIATRTDWGLLNSAAAIPGSPYHTRLIEFDGSGGNQDRSLLAEAVIFPGSITIIKDATPDGSQSFGFTASPSPLAGFSLVDDPGQPDDNHTKIFSNITTFQTYTVTENALPDWKLSSTVVCTATSPNGGSTSQISRGVTIDMKEGENWTCTFTNIGTRLTVTKTLVPSSDTGKFNLQIDGSTAGSGANVGDGGTTGAVLVTAASHTVSETAVTGTSLSDYVTTFGGDCDSSGNVTLAAGDNKTCTITNTRKPKLTVTKTLVPSSDAGLFNLQIDGSTAGTGANVGNGGTTGAIVQSVGPHTAGETAGTGTSLSDYTTVIGGDCAANGSITLAAGDNKTCTITNTRKAHTVKLIKSLVPNTDSGKFDLTAAGTTATAQGDGGSAQNTSVAVGTAGVSVSEIANVASGTSLSNYTSVLTCSGATIPASTTSASFTMPDNDVTCTVTNTRKTHKVRLTKALVPTNDPGLFNLTAAGTLATDRTNLGFAENGAVAVGTTGVSVSEAAGTSTSLVNYTSSLSCDNGASGSTSASFTMPDADVACTVTNTSKTHAVKLIKSLAPAGDGGLFDLTAAGTTVTAQGNGGFALNSSVAVGTAGVSVGEIANAASGTSLANYTSSLSCVGVSATGTTSATFTMPDSDVTCTVTNTRKTHKVRLTKALVPTNDPGLFNLTAAGTLATDRTNLGFAENGAVAVGTTGVSVSEAAGTSTSLVNYTSSLSCDNGASGSTSASFTMPDADVACTVTNTRKTHKVTLTKALVPTNDPGLFNLTAAGTTANNQGNGGSAQNASVAVGTTGVTVGEAAGTGTDLSNYTSALSCSGVSATGTTSATFTMPDNDVACTVTNTRKTHAVKLIKSLAPAGDGGLFDLTAAGTTVTAQGNGGFALNSSVAVGTAGVSVGEIANAASGTSLANYTSSLSCVGVSATGTTSASFTMPDNDVTCTVTNTRKAHAVKLIKALVPTNDTGLFNLTAAGTTANDQGNGGFALNSNVVGGTAGVVVSEAAGTGTNLSNYTSSLSCDNGASGTTSAGFTMPDNDVTCTVTNTRKTHKVTLTKALVPTNDPGLFNLTAAGTTANDKGNGGSVQNASVAVGTTGVSVSEAAGTGANLSNYTSSLSCDNGATGTTSASFTMPDADVACTVTNTRKTHKVTLTKALVPTNDPGLFNLTAAGTTANNQGNGGSVQNASVAMGTTGVSVSEAAGTATNLNNYTSSMSCDNGATGTTSASFTMPDADVACTVTNTRKTHAVKLIKSLVPSTDAGRFDLTAAGTTATAQGDGGFALNSSVAVGTTNVSVNEIANAASATDLANYTSSLSCVGVSATGTTSATFTMPDNDVTCTVTNTKKAFVKVTKTENLVAPTVAYTFNLSGGPDNVNISLTTGSTNGGVLDFSSGGGLKPGNYTLCELLVPAGTTSTLQTFPGATVDTTTGTTCAPITLAAGGTYNFVIDNSHPLGGQRTIGYWKNWNTCASSNGNQVKNAAATGHVLLNQLLPIVLVPPDPSTGYAGVTVTTCAQAVDILSNASGKYAEHTLAAQLLAALLNKAAAGGQDCPAAEAAIQAAQSLLQQINWNGSSTSKIVDSNHPLRSQFTSVSATLDAYNNEKLCI